MSGLGLCIWVTMNKTRTTVKHTCGQQALVLVIAHSFGTRLLAGNQALTFAGTFVLLPIVAGSL